MNSHKEIGDWFDQRGVKLVLFDLDDTLIATHQTIMIYVRRLWDFLKQSLPETLEKNIIIDYEIFLREAREAYSVNPNKIWSHTLRRFEEKYHIPVEKAGLKIIMRTYSHLPPILEGVHNTLGTLRDARIRMGVLTHALPKWTTFKMKGNNLHKYFERIEVSDVNKHKDSEDWRGVIEKFKVAPHEVLVVGDNVKGDIIAAHQIGVRQLVWIDNNRDWAAHREGEIPAKTIVIQGMHELIDSLINHFELES